MLRLKNRETPPPNGYWVDVPEIRFREQFWDFGSAVRALWQALQANPGVQKRFKHLPKTHPECEPYVDAMNAQRVSRLPGTGSYVTEGGPAIAVPFSTAQPARQVAPRAGTVGGEASRPPSWFKRIKSGVTTIADWLGEGGVSVAADLSEKRAAVCAQCPQNRGGDLFSHFTGPVANLLRRQLEQRQELKLSTTHDAKLGVCQACGCPLRLKIHVPLVHILKHMPATEQNNLDPNCWIKNQT